MIELLLTSGVEMRDALLHSINEEFVEAVELLLDHETLIHVPGTLARMLLFVLVKKK